MRTFRKGARSARKNQSYIAKWFFFDGGESGGLRWQSESYNLLYSKATLNTLKSNKAVQAWSLMCVAHRLL